MRSLRSFAALVRFVSLRHAQASPVRSLLVLFGVALGVAMVVGMTAANQAVLRSFDDLADRAGGKADLSATQDELGVHADLLDALTTRRDLVAHAAPRMERTTFLAGDAGKPGERILVFGLDFVGDKFFLPFEQTEGDNVLDDPLAFLNDPNAILVSEVLAQRRGLHVDSELRMRTAHGLETFRVAGLLRESKRSKSFGGQWAVLSLDAAQLAFERGNLVDGIDLALAPGVTVARAKPELQALVSDRATIDRPSARAEQVARMSATFQLAIQVQAMVAVLVGMFLIYNAVAVSVGQRKREIGILRSVGVSQGRVALVFVAEAAVMGAVGSVLGIGFGKGIATIVLQAMGPNIARFYESVVMPEPTVSPTLALSGFLIGVVATLLAAWWPARQAARVPPVEALRRDLHAASRTHWPVKRLAVIGAAMCLIGYGSIYVRFRFHGFVGVGFLLLGSVALVPFTVVHLARILRPLSLQLFGIPGRLGVDNVEREMGRSTLTAAALVLATGTSLTMATYTHSYEASCLDWLDQAIPADLFVTAGSPLVDKNAIAYPADVASKLGTIPGVAAVNPVRSISLQAYGRRVEMLAVEGPIYLKQVADKGGRHVVEGPNPLPPETLSGDEPSLVLSEATSARTGKHKGDTFELPSPTGTHAFRIVGVVIDYSSDQGWAMIDRRWLKEFWHDDQVEATDLFLAPGASIAEVQAKARELLGATAGDEGGYFVTSNAVLKEEVRGVLRSTLGVSKAAETISLIVAVLGVIGTMLAAVIDRTREIGVLRAIGATRTQVLGAIVAEAGFLGLTSVFVGVLSAIPTSMVLMNAVGFEATGWTIPFLFPTPAAIRIVTMIFTFALLSGVLPGLRAARLVVTRALAYE